jgi:sarcosine oxidase subunit beta
VKAEAEVAIIGGGLIGCMTAYYLRKRERSVILLDRGFVGGQSSGVSFGSLRLQGQHGVGLTLALRAQELWEGIEAELGESVEFAQGGHVHLALAADHIGRLETNATAMRAHGLAPVLLDRLEALRCWPFLGPSVLAASVSQRDAVVNPRLVAPAFARAARSLGASIHERMEAVAIGATNGRFVIESVGPDGTPSTIVAAILVNAAGAWAPRVAGQFGETIPSFAAGPAEMVTEPIPPFVSPVMHAVDGSILFRQTRRGNVVIGGHPRLPVDAETLRTRVPPEKIATNLARLTAVAPFMRAHHVIRTWTGIEGYLPDMMPVIGPSETTPGLFHACAFSGHGLQLGPAVGMALAELITTGSTGIPIGPFGIARLRGPARAVSTMGEEFQADVEGRG